jgi:hypothetical protein
MPFIYFCFVGVIIRQSFKSSVYTYVGTIVGAASLLYFFPRFFTPEELGAFRLNGGSWCAISWFWFARNWSKYYKIFPHFVDEKGSVNGFLFLALSIPVIGSIIVSMVYILNKDLLLSFFDVDDRTYWHYLHACFIHCSLQDLSDSISKISRRIIAGLLQIISFER